MGVQFGCRLPLSQNLLRLSELHMVGSDKRCVGGNNLNMNSPWTPESWQKRQSQQQPKYDNPQELADAIRRLTTLPPLVTAWEVDRLRTQLAIAEEGNAFVLQGGDCSESFDDCNSPSILRKLKVLIQMSLVLICGSKKKLSVSGALPVSMQSHVRPTRKNGAT